MDDSLNEPDKPRGALAKIETILKSHESSPSNGDGQISLGELSDLMEERAFGLLLLILALPCCLPFIYLLPQIVALPMAVLAWQMAAGHSAPVLPETLRKRRLPVEGLLSVVARAKQYGGWLEKLAHPRFAGLSEGISMRVVGGFLIIPCLSILVPLPLTNTVPGVGVALASVGLIERDGLFVIVGLIVGLVWVLALVVGGPALIYLIVDFVMNRAPAT